MEDDLDWLDLLDELYALVEADFTAAMPGRTRAWRDRWQPLVQRWAARIGARSIQIDVGEGPLQWPAAAAGLLYHRRITSRDPDVSAWSLSPHGFTARQVTDFHAVCRHLRAALEIRSSLDGAQASLSALYRVVDALPMGLVVLDEHWNVVMLNRGSRELLARDEALVLREQRLCLPAQQAALDQALLALEADPSAGQRHLHLNGLDIELKKLDHVGAAVLLLIHEPCDPARLRDIAPPPPQLALQMQQQYGLSDKELPLAWNVAQGMPLKQYAALSGRSIETVRAQLKSVFRKLGAGDQKSLGLVFFETWHAVRLQSLGAQLAAVTGECLAGPPQPARSLRWP